MNEVIARKVTSMQRCVSRAREELTRAGGAFATDHTAQDAAILNVIRACETTIDLANMVIRKRQLGIPSETRESFTILMQEQLLGQGLGTRLQKMVGFRNVAVHRYQELDMRIVEAVIRDGLDDLLVFADTVRSILDEGEPGH
jgi:uncharacterized protein YutE (UPF0331/DUF86 family)